MGQMSFSMNMSLLIKEYEPHVYITKSLFGASMSHACNSLISTFEQFESD